MKALNLVLTLLFYSLRALGRVPSFLTTSITMRDRSHLALDTDAPEMRPMQPRPSTRARVVAHRRLGGLHHCYAWRDAA